MKKFVLCALTLLTLLAACKNDSSSGSGNGIEANPNGLAGNWVALSFCSRINQMGSVLKAMNTGGVPYAYALSFDAAHLDSATCFNGIETWKLPIKINVDTIELVGARPGKSIFLVFDGSGKEFQMFDATGPRTQLDRFTKSNSQPGTTGAQAFRSALNRNLLPERYVVPGKPDQIIRFQPDGNVLGWPEFRRYEVCMAGDCFVTGDQADIVNLSSGRADDSGKTFGLRLTSAGDTLTLYNLVETNPNEKGSSQLGSMAYRFVQAPPEKGLPPTAKPKERPSSPEPPKH